MLVMAFTGFALASAGAVTLMSSATVQRIPVKQPSVTRTRHGLQCVSSPVPTAGPAAAAPPAPFPGAFLQSQPLTKAGMLLGDPGDSGCPIRGPMRAVACCGP